MGDTYDASGGRSNAAHFEPRLVGQVAERPLKPVSHSTHGLHRNRQIDRRITAQNAKWTSGGRGGADDRSSPTEWPRRSRVPAPTTEFQAGDWHLDGNAA